MTPEAQHQAIAEACGYYLIHDEETNSVALRNGDVNYRGPWHRAGDDANQFAWEDAPDYLADLNAMRDAVMSRDNDERWAIFAALAQIVPAEIPSACGSAAQWAEAFLKTSGKWDDSR